LPESGETELRVAEALQQDVGKGMVRIDNDLMNEIHIVDNEEILIGRNDEVGYYFKFGIYRVGNSKIPVKYNLAGYKEKDIH